MGAVIKYVLVMIFVSAVGGLSTKPFNKFAEDSVDSTYLSLNQTCLFVTDKNVYKKNIDDLNIEENILLFYLDVNFNNSTDGDIYRGERSFVWARKETGIDLLSIMPPDYAALSLNTLSYNVAGMNVDVDILNPSCLVNVSSDYQTKLMINFLLLNMSTESEQLCYENGSKDLLCCGVSQLKGTMLEAQCSVASQNEYLKKAKTLIGVLFYIFTFICPLVIVSYLPEEFEPLEPDSNPRLSPFEGSFPIRKTFWYRGTKVFSLRAEIYWQSLKRFIYLLVILPGCLYLFFIFYKSFDERKLERRYNNMLQLLDAYCNFFTTFGLSYDCTASHTWDVIFYCVCFTGCIFIICKCTFQKMFTSFAVIHKRSKCCFFCEKVLQRKNNASVSDIALVCDNIKRHMKWSILCVYIGFLGAKKIVFRQRGTLSPLSASFRILIFPLLLVFYSGLVFWMSLPFIYISATAIDLLMYVMASVRKRLQSSAMFPGRILITLLILPLIFEVLIVIFIEKLIFICLFSIYMSSLILFYSIAGVVINSKILLPYVIYGLYVLFYIYIFVHEFNMKYYNLKMLLFKQCSPSQDNNQNLEPVYFKEKKTPEIPLGLYLQVRGILLPFWPNALKSFLQLAMICAFLLLIMFMVLGFHKYEIMSSQATPLLSLGSGLIPLLFRVLTHRGKEAAKAFNLEYQVSILIEQYREGKSLGLDSNEELMESSEFELVDVNDSSTSNPEDLHIHGDPTT